MPSSVTRLTALDHDRLSRLLRRTCSPGPSQQRWRDELVHLARAHLDAEDQALAGVHRDGERSAVTASGVDDGVRVRLDDLLDRVAGLSLADAELSDLCDDLGSALTEHARLLHERVLAPLEQSLPRKELRRLGGAYGELRDRALRDYGEAEPPPRRLDLSRAELYELAKKAGIEGRSSMSRRDLIERLLQREQAR